MTSRILWEVLTLASSSIGRWTHSPAGWQLGGPILSSKSTDFMNWIQLVGFRQLSRPIHAGTPPVVYTPTTHNSQPVLLWPNTHPLHTLYILHPPATRRPTSYRWSLSSSRTRAITFSAGLRASALRGPTLGELGRRHGCHLLMAIDNELPTWGQEALCYRVQPWRRRRRTVRWKEVVKCV